LHWSIATLPWHWYMTFTSIYFCKCSFNLFKLSWSEGLRVAIWWMDRPVL
jgi:hypothetical protein